MRFKILITLIILLHCNLFSQYNLVENGDFEYFTTSDTYDYCGQSAPHGWYKQDDLETYWSGVWPWQPPKHIGANMLGSSGSPDLLCDYGIRGPNYVSMVPHEYLVAPLRKSLKTDKYYYVEFYFLNDYNEKLGIKFYNSKPEQTKSTHFIEDDGTVDISEDGYTNTGIPKYPLSTITWKKVSKYYKATEDFSWIALGGFNEPSSGTLEIDGIRIIEVGGSDCPEWNLIENTNYTDDVHLVYRSSYITGVGNDIDHNQDNGHVTVAAQSTVTLKSANLVIMEDGFSVPEGGTLHAYIAPCDADCFPPVADAGTDKIICDGTPGGLSANNQLGTTASVNPDVSYQWISTPAPAVNFLSCTDCPNPYINASGLGYNAVLYELTVSNACGQATDKVKVVIDLDAFLYTPSVLATNINADNYIDFDLTFDNHTEWIKIEVYQNSNNNLVYTKQLNRGDDFITSPFHWQIDQYLKVCHDYTIKIYSKNFCEETLSAVQTIPWIRDKTINISALPNVFSPPNPPNAQLCYNATGVDEYEIEVKDSWGVTIYSNSGDYAPLNGCLWDGTCNGGLTSCSNNNAPNGSYYIVVKFKNCLASVEKAHYVYLARDVYKLNQNNTMSEYQTKTKLYPNPTNALFTIIPSALMLNNYIVEITDAMNKLIYKAVNQNQKLKEIDMSFYGKGVYYVRVYNNTENYFDKLIVN